MYDIITGSAARYNFGAHYNIAAHMYCINLNPLPHGVLASFYLTAAGLLRPPEEDDIRREKTILMT